MIVSISFKYKYINALQRSSHKKCYKYSTSEPGIVNAHNSRGCYSQREKIREISEAREDDRMDREITEEREDDRRQDYRR